jgi:hypothetical protein
VTEGQQLIDRAVKAEEQRRAALARAEEVRRERAQVRREIRFDERSVISALDEPCCQTATLYSLVAQRVGFGRFRSLTVLRRFDLPPYRLVRDLTIRQRVLLAEAMEIPPARVGCS